MTRSNRRVRRTNRKVGRTNRKIRRTNRKVRRTNRKVRRTNRKVRRINSHRKIKGGMEGSDLQRTMTEAMGSSNLSRTMTRAVESSSLSGTMTGATGVADTETEENVRLRARTLLNARGLDNIEIENILKILKEQHSFQSWINLLSDLTDVELGMIIGKATEENMEIEGLSSEDAAPSELTRQHSPGTEYFLNHQRIEKEKKEVSASVYKAKIKMYGDGPIVGKPCASIEVGMSDTIGERRSMEDCMTIFGNYRDNTDEDFFAVFDGHGGSHVAQFAAMNAPRVIEAHIAANGGVIDESIFESAFGDLDTLIYKSLGHLAEECGSTAVIAIIKGNTLYVANVGDSRAVLDRPVEEARVSKDHKPGDEGEISRIEELGGTVVELRGVHRVEGNLAVARAFGDFGLKRYISEVPYTSTTKLSLDPDEEKDRALILACDGLWDVVSDQEALDLVINACSRGVSAKGAADILRDEALERNSKDNISVMVSILKPIAKHPREVMGFFSTTDDGNLGIIFGNEWPFITRINEGSLAEMQPQIKVGMKLLSINGQPMDGYTFVEAKPLVKERPLKLVFMEQRAAEAGEV